MIDPLKSGWLVVILVAVLPALLGVLGNLVSREARTPRAIRNLGHLADSLAKTPDGSEARDALSDLVAEYSRRLETRLVVKKKLNKMNLSFTVVLLVFTGFVMYWLVRWTTGLSGTGWEVPAVVLTSVVGLILFVFNIAAVATWYNPPSEQKPAPKTDLEHQPKPTEHVEEEP